MEWPPLPSGTGKTHVALGLGLAACQRGLSTGFTTAAMLVHELMEARDERRLLRLQKQMVANQVSQSLRYFRPHPVSNHLTTDNVLGARGRLMAML